MRGTCGYADALPCASTRDGAKPRGRRKMSSAEEITRLRDCVSPLVGSTAIGALWTDDEPGRVVRTVLNAPLGLLGSAFVFVRLATEIDLFIESDTQMWS